MGKPIHVKQHDKPDLAEVMEVQQRYIAELTRWVHSLERTSEVFLTRLR